MSRIIVTTGTKTKQADPITEPILSGDIALIERGKAEIYHECVDRNIIDIEFALYPKIPFPAEIVKITEDSMGLIYSGVVTSFSISVSKDNLSLQNSIEVAIL